MDLLPVPGRIWGPAYHGEARCKQEERSETFPREGKRIYSNRRRLAPKKERPQGNGRVLLIENPFRVRRRQIRWQEKFAVLPHTPAWHRGATSDSRFDLAGLLRWALLTSDGYEKNKLGQLEEARETSK